MRPILNYRADVRSLILLGLCLAALAVQWSGVWRSPALYTVTLYLVFTSCVINHNHQHRPMFSVPLLNRLFGVYLSLTTGQPASAIVPMHNLNHHAHNNHEEDFVRASIVRWRWNLFNLIAFPFVALASYGPGKRDILRTWASQCPARNRQLRLERRGLYPVLVVLFILAPAATLVYVLLPYVIGQWGIIAMNLVQHDGCDPDSEFCHSRNFTGRCTNWWMLNNGFHTVHHEHPNIHWSELPPAHAAISHRIDPELNCPSLVKTLCRFYLLPGGRPRRHHEQPLSQTRRKRSQNGRMKASTIVSSPEEFK